MCSNLKYPSFSYQISAVYRPPPSPANGLTLSLIWEEFNCVMNNQAPGLGQHVIMGGFNFHMDADAGSSTHFRELLEIHGLQQHVTESTHVRGHILDLVITHIDADSISESLIDDPGISDHSAVFFKLRGHTPAPPPKKFTYRAYRKIDINLFTTIHDGNSRRHSSMNVTIK